MEPSVFGTEFVVTKNGIATTHMLRYNIQMMDVQLDDPLYLYSDTINVFHITHCSGSLLKKKSNSICYHAVRVPAVMGVSIFGHTPSVNTLADMRTLTRLCLVVRSTTT
jgi:hypothetical protein